MTVSIKLLTQAEVRYLLKTSALQVTHREDMVSCNQV